MGNRELGIASPPGSSTRSCPTHGRLQHQKVTVSLNPEELAAALRRLKPGNSLGLDSIFPEFMLHAGSALKPWLCDTSVLACTNSKFQKSGEEH